jgi:trimethylamine--corrinoid protein Co-methyltransferase
VKDDSMARRAGRSRGRRKAGGLRQLEWRDIVNQYAPVEVLSADQVEAVHQASLEVLATTGMRILYDEARRLYRQAGADVDDATQRVRFDPALIESHVQSAPRQFVLHARNPGRNLPIGGNSLVFNSIGGPAYCSDLERGRRTGTYADMCEFLKLVQSLNIIHQEGGGPFEPMDLPPESRHLDLYLAQSRLLDKNCQAYPLGRHRTRDCIEMTAIAHGIERDALLERPAIMGIINTNSPLQLDVPMAEATIELARSGQVACITPFTLSGAMSPATIAGTLVAQNAEVLAGVLLTQIVNPGAPVIYGSFASNVDMRSGSPAFGTPEYTRTAIASGQLARRYGLPYRSSNTNASNAVDAQATYESSMSLWGAVMGHANIINHAAGWLEGGLTASYEKLIVDAEMLQMMAEFLVPPEVSDATLGVEAIAEVGPAGHFFAAADTISRYETAFYSPLLSDWRNYENWEEAGAVDATHRAHAIWKQLLAEYQQPALDEGIEEALCEYVARRKHEIHAGVN